MFLEYLYKAKGITLKLSLMAICLTLSACGNDEALPAAALTSAIPVSTITAEIGDIIVVGEYIGRMEPRQQVSVFPRIAGEVQSVYFAVGDWVEAGDVLFTIDAIDIINNISALEAQLEVQNAAVRAAQTGVTLADGSAMQSQILQASGSVNQAESAIIQAESGISQAEQNLGQALIAIDQAQVAYDISAQSLQDTSALFDAGVATRVAFDQAEMNYSNALSGLERAQSGYSIAVIALSQAQQGLLQAQQGLEQALEAQRIITGQAPVENRIRAQDGLAQAQAARNTITVNIQAARDRLEDAVVRSPISGIIEMRNVEVFDMAMPQASAFTISAQDSMTVSFRVPRGSAAYIELGDTVSLLYGGADYPGIVTEISTAVDAGGLLAIQAEINRPPDGIFSGSSVRIFADAQRAENVTLLPLAAIHYDRGVPYVLVADNGFARRIQVEVGIFDANYIQIVSGIDITDQIINTWNPRLAEGVEIEILGV